MLEISVKAKESVSVPNSQLNSLLLSITINQGHLLVVNYNQEVSAPPTPIQNP